VIADVTRPGFLREHLDAIRAALEGGTLDAAAGADTLRAAMPGDGTGPPSSRGDPTGADGAPFLGRDPVVSLLQTSLEERLRDDHPDEIEEDAPARDDTEAQGSVAHVVQWLRHPERFSRDDPRWITGVAGAVARRLERGNHPFNPVPARAQIADDARVVLVGDWGTGLPRARAVAAFMREEVEDALADGREAHVIHLGDVYYSGDDAEYDRRLLADGLWPADAGDAAGGVTSWSLNGNHDMYSGGWGYFDHLLAEERFAAQRSPDGRGTSFFRITSPSWELVGLDTSWEADPLSLGRSAALHDPQAAFVARVAGESDRKLALLSHHQFVSVHDPQEIDGTLPSKLADVLASGRVTAWFWGHEHRCMGYAATGGVAAPRCLGHGGVPVVVSEGLGAPVPAPGIWEERGFLDEGGRHWGRFGFAVLDFAGPRIAVRYRDDLGRVTRTEAIA
jgi:calcineurin-like phosphoesterase family protein